jgi:hypothetical protein
MIGCSSKSTHISGAPTQTIADSAEHRGSIYEVILELVAG